MLKWVSITCFWKITKFGNREDIKFLYENIIYLLSSSNKRSSNKYYIFIYSGWGTTSFGGPTSDVLLKTRVQVVEQRMCLTVFNQSAASGKQVCTFTPGKDTCQVNNVHKYKQIIFFLYLPLLRVNWDNKI